MSRAAAPPPASSRLNFHHRHCFWAVARGGNLTRTAEKRHVSQSALSKQIELLEEQLGRLRMHTPDLILSNRRAHASAEEPWRCRRIARQPVSRVGKPRPRRKAYRFPDERAEADNAALLRLLARDSDRVALVSTVVVQDESQSGRLAEYTVVPGLHETFFAISLQRHFEPPLLKGPHMQSEAAVLGSAGAGKA